MDTNSRGEFLKSLLENAVILFVIIILGKARVANTNLSS